MPMALFLNFATTSVFGIGVYEHSFAFIVQYAISDDRMFWRISTFIFVLSACSVNVLHFVLALSS